jgi:predicted transcriptional regulator
LVQQVSASKEFYDLLFEVSNEYRHGILILLEGRAMRITDIAKETGLNNPEIRRHISRLRDVGLIQRDVEGLYHLTPYGETSLLLFREFEFLSSNSEYFKTHSLSGIPTSSVKQIGELRGSTSLENAMDFFRHAENLFKESRDSVWLLVDQFPMNSISTIVETINRGVRFRIIEPSERILNPDLDAMTSEEVQALNRTRRTPLVEQRMVDEVSLLLFISDSRCVLAFPSSDGQYDFKGFTSTQDPALKWCRELFQRYWDEAETRRPSLPSTPIEPGRILRRVEPSDAVVVEGRDRPDIDAQAVQDAVDHYGEVVLRGTFNFGPSSVRISRSVVVRGEGRENGIPSTAIYKKGWSFPFTEFDSIFKIDGEGAEVTIENIRFTDFNHTCIWGVQCSSLSVKENRITLMTGYGRGMTYGAFGDVVIAIWIQGMEPSIFKGRATIEGNYIDFARGGAFGGFLTRGGLEEDPEYRPNLFNHEYYMGFGIAEHRVSGTVIIENNVIRNANARGIAATGNLPSAQVRIRNNAIVSDVYGSYPFSSPESGAGILAQSAWGFPSPGFDVEIEGNTIDSDKPNYSGIIVLGPVMDREGADKLRGGVIQGNSIRLRRGYEGIHVRKCDEFEVAENKISGDAYYGIRISGRSMSTGLNLMALSNRIEGNDMGELRIREPDKYSDGHAGGRMFKGLAGGSVTAHFWMDEYSKNNSVKIKTGETVLDDGENNTIIREDGE